MKKLFLNVIAGALVVSGAYAQEHSFISSDFTTELMSPAASRFVKLNGDTYDQKNWLNPVLHNLYMVNNRSEAAQHRINLQNVSNLTKGQIQYLDLLGSDPVDWTSLSQKRFKEEIQKFHSIVGIVTSNLDQKDANVIVLFSSTSHNLLSASTLDTVQDLTRAGHIVVMMEYPGYGGSLGTPSKANWEKASEGLIIYLKKMLPNYPLFLVGHSLGAPVAMHVASRHPELVAGVVSHAGFYDLMEASKDSSKFLFSNAIAPIVTRLLAKNENWDAAKSINTLARKGVPTLILHGRNDSSVSFRHFQLLGQSGMQLKKTYPKYPLYSQSYDSTHEDIFANANYSPFYNDIWKTITDFMKKSAQN